MQKVRLTKQFVDEVFETCENQGDVLLSLYKAVFPEWDTIAELKGYPKCNDHTWKYIAKLFMAFDQKFHPEVMNGGAWMNSGFSCSQAEHLRNFEVERCDFETVNTFEVDLEALAA